MDYINIIFAWIKRNKWQIIAGVLLAGISWAGYLRFVEKHQWADWTELGSYTAQDGTFYPAKNLWDVLELLIVPAALGAIALWFNRQEKIREQNLADERWRREHELNENLRLDDVLQNYLDRMTELLLKEKLLEKKDSEEDPVVEVAQIRTVTTLRILNNERRNILLRFLKDANLSSFVLKGANMREMNLSEAKLSKTNLMRAYLKNANLSGADLREASLRKTFLSGTNLCDADLSGADLSGAYLGDAYLYRADLTNATLAQATNWTLKQLEQAKFLTGATMPDGTIHE